MIDRLNHNIKELINDEKKIRYVLVGIWNTIFSYLAFVFLYFFLKEKLHYVLILVVSQIVGLTNAYVCYKLFVFKTKGNVIREYFRFYLVYGSTFLVNLILIFIFVEVLGASPLISQAVIALIVVTMAYVGHSRFSFNSK